jgi:succinate-acetate transporter protein
LPLSQHFRKDELLKQNTGALQKKANITKTGGYFGVITALIAYYCGLAEMLGPDDIISLPLGKHDRRD